jgi:hypothetical protein
MPIALDSRLLGKAICIKQVGTASKGVTSVMPIKAPSI